jgi:hypothetical protein
MTGVACLKPGVLGFMMKFPFAATPVLVCYRECGIENRL